MIRRTSFSMRHAFAGFALVGALLVPMLMNAQVNRSAPPPPGPAPLVKLGAHTTFVLENGMRVIVVENHKLPTISVQVKFDIEPFAQGEIAGVSELVGDLIGAGTTRQTKVQIDEAVDGMGARLFGSNDGLYIAGLKKHFNQMMGLVYEITVSSSFPPEEFQKAKKRALSSLQQRDEDPDAIADVVSRSLTYGRFHPYGEVTTEKSMSCIERKHVEGYYKRFFDPKQGYIVFVGDISAEEARTISTKYFGQWRGAENLKVSTENGVEIVDGLGPVKRMDRQPEPRGVRRIAIVDRPGAAQSVIRVTFPVNLHPADPHAINAQVLNTALGGGVFNARLMQNLREDKGFTYGSYSSLNTDKYVGEFMATASVRTPVTDSAVTEILFELENIQLNKMKQEELQLVKNYLAGSFARSLEDPRTIARFALNTYLYELPADHYDTYLKRLDTVTVAGVQKAANDFLRPDNAAVLVVGDKGEVGNKLVPLSFDRNVTQLDANGAPYREEVLRAPADMTAEQVIDRYLEVCGGRSKIAGLKDVRTVMSADIQGMPITVTQWFSAPDRSAMEMRSGAMVIQKEVFDGTRGIRSGMEGPEEVIEMELDQMKYNAHPFPELRYKERGRLLLSGIADVDGVEAYKITCMLDDGGIFYEYFDVNTGFKLRHVEPRSTDMGNMTITSTYRDYRPEGGVQFPHLIEQNAGVQISLVVIEMEVDKGLDPSLFVIEQ